MTIPTPTNDPAGAVRERPGLTLDLPDLATLNRLAGEFFSALPGYGGAAAYSSPSNLNPSLPPGVPAESTKLLQPQPAQGLPVVGAVPGANLAPASPQSAGNYAAAPKRSLTPHAAAPNGLPDQVTQAAPGIDGRTGSYALGVPEAYAAALPLSDVVAPATRFGAPSTPYYFLGEGGGYPSSIPGLNESSSLDAAIPREDRVTAQSFGLPGADELRALLRLDAQPSAAGVPVAAPAQQGNYYFVDHAPAPGSFGGAIPNAAASPHPPFDVNAIRRDFPILQERVNGRPLIWFDNAATTQKPQSVIDRLSYFYAHENSNIHRAAHELAARATDAYEAARDKVARFLGAGSAEEIVFVRGATEAINLVAKSWGAKNISAGDEIIVSHLEHHANIVPWQQLASEKGAKLRVIPVDDSGQVLLEEYQRLLNDRTKLVSVTEVSNALGTVVPVKEIVALAHRAGAKALVDGAQSVPHLRANVQDMDADFFVFSGHKLFGPTGIGVVYGKREVLEDMPPWQGGGNMIADVTFERTVYQPPPSRFEAGTGNIADAVGLGAAIDYIERIGIENIARYEHGLLAYATGGMLAVPGLRLIGTARDKASVLSFVLDGYQPEEVGKALNQEGIAVRAGHHCAQPILRRFGLEATVRPSLAFYNTCQEVDVLVAALLRLAGSRSIGKS